MTEKQEENRYPEPKLPARARVYDGNKEGIGLVRNGKWVDYDGTELGEFIRDDRGILLRSDDKDIGYLDVHGNIVNGEGMYIATLVKRRLYPLVMILLCLLAIAALTLFIVTCSLNRSGEPYIPTIFVFGADGADWSETENLPIFENERPDGKIAPGTSGEYRFSVENANDDDVVFSFEFAEECEYDIGIVYGLQRDGSEISGEERKPIEELGIGDLTINAGSSTTFVLSWNWPYVGDDETDTAAGIAAADYTIHISVTAEILAR